MSRRTVAIVALAMSCSIAVGACSDDHDTPSATHQSPTPSVAAATDHSSPPTDEGDGSGADFCTYSTGINPGALATGSAADLADLKHTLDAAIAAAPSDIKDDLQTVANLEGPLLDGQAPAGQIEHTLSDPRFRTALEHIAAWSASHCGTG